MSEKALQNFANDNQEPFDTISQYKINIAQDNLTHAIANKQKEKNEYVEDQILTNAEFSEYLIKPIPKKSIFAKLFNHTYDNNQENDPKRIERLKKLFTFLQQFNILDSEGNCILKDDEIKKVILLVKSNFHSHVYSFSFIDGILKVKLHDDERKAPLFEIDSFEEDEYRKNKIVSNGVNKFNFSYDPVNKSIFDVQTNLRSSVHGWLDIMANDIERSNEGRVFVNPSIEQIRELTSTKRYKKFRQMIINKRNEVDIAASELHEALVDSNK